MPLTQNSQPLKVYLLYQRSASYSLQPNMAPGMVFVLVVLRAYQLRIFSRLLHGWGKPEAEEYFVAHEHYLKLTFQHTRKQAHWTPVMPVRLGIAVGCSCAPTAESSSCNRNLVGLKSLKYLLFGTLWKKFVIPCSISTEIHCCPVMCSNELGHMVGGGGSGKGRCHWEWGWHEGAASGSFGRHNCQGHSLSAAKAFLLLFIFYFFGFALKNFMLFFPLTLAYFSVDF